MTDSSRGASTASLILMIRAALVLLAAWAAAPAATAASPAAPATAVLEVDAREAPRGILRVHLTLPVGSGALTLIYPKWLPGEHAPNGPVAGLSALAFSVGGNAVPWQRDPIDMYAFHLTVPARATALDVAFEVDSLLGATPPNALRTATESLAIVLWNQLLFYPAGVRSDAMQVAAKLRLPTGWNWGSALAAVGTVGDATQFKPVSLTTLIDSPVLAGRHFETLVLGGRPAVSLHVAADSAAALDMPAAMLGHLRKLVQEAGALFGATHYDEYHFLWTLSDLIDYEGIEHHQSSDNRTAERTFIDDELRRSSNAATLLPHEYTHSWNGKYRRPIGLATGNYDTPMRGDLLWVYEGLTEYWGMVLSARSGLQSEDDAREAWADLAAGLESRKGRDWRPLADTAIAAQLGYTQPPEWASRTRATDFYQESAMLWLEADALIRSRSHGRKSLDDFAKSFYGAPSTPPGVSPYDFDDLIKALGGVLPYDWRTFWTERLNRVRAEAPLEGLAASGWRLRFDAVESPEQKANDAFDKKTNLKYSLGFSLRDDGAVITDLISGSPADAAGIAPDAHLIAVDGRKYSKDVLQDALKSGGDGLRSIQLLIQKDDMYRTVELRYAGHARFPHLERDPSVPDLLTAIGAAQTP
jgi:predicted metalloprotease with PDZ domain